MQRVTRPSGPAPVTSAPAVAIQVAKPVVAERVLVIIRGVPGAGKSTITAMLTMGRPWAVVCSADHYFTRGGVYRFDPAKLSEAHDACIANAEDAMMGGRALVIIDNCNTSERAMEPYEELARRFGYTVSHIVIERRGSRRKNVHGVPAERVDEMAARLQASIKV